MKNRFKAKPLSWKPARRGHIYCSPACGGNCTMGEYKSALKSAEALAKKCGPPFKARVWENLGWHYDAVASLPSGDQVTVTAFANGFWARINGLHGSDVMRNPQLALMSALKDLDVDVETLVALSNNMRMVLGLPLAYTKISGE